VTNRTCGSYRLPVGLLSLLFVIQIAMKIYKKCVKRLMPTGHYMYCQFNTQQFYVLPPQCIYVFCVDLRTNSDCFHIQH